MNDAFGHPQSVLVLGGTSDIARALVPLLTEDRGRSVVLAGRDRVGLEHAAKDLRHRVARVATVTFDAGTLEDVDKTVMRCFEAAAEAIDLVIVAVGELGRQEVDEIDPSRIARMMTVNLTWPAAALSVVAGQLRQQGYGRIIVLSSVAGIRIRRSNFVYGSAKAGLDSYARGLGEALRGSGVSVHIVRPGFVRTKMTAGLPAAPFAIDASQVASDIVAGLARDQTVIWSPGLLRWVFSALRLLPRALWRRLPG
jgi:decaprenylphospho-beta-D-erythro-pentofuranosid-2-ulose 2-reductase